MKLHTLLDLRGSIPTNVYVTGGQVHDVNILDQLLPEAGAFYLLDRGYVDFARLHVLAQACAFFVTRAKKNMQFYRRNSRPVERSYFQMFAKIHECNEINAANLITSAFRGIPYPSGFYSETWNPGVSSWAGPLAATTISSSQRTPNSPGM